MKKCIKCNEEKSLEEFYRHKNTLQSFCKICFKERRKKNYILNKEKELKKSKEYYENNKEFYKEYTKKYRDTILKEKNKIERRGRWFNKYLKNKIEIDKYFNQIEITIDNVEQYVREYNRHKTNSKKIEYYKKWYEENKEYISDYQRVYKKENEEKFKKYYEENKEKINKRNVKYIKNRLKKDSVFKLKFNIRSLIRGSFKRGKNQFRKDAKTEEILGCTIEEFRIYIESKLKKGMTFDNYGEWHLDHIIPLANAKTREDIIKLNHYTNFQPLWAKDNLKKSSKILNTQLKLI